MQKTFGTFLKYGASEGDTTSIDRQMIDDVTSMLDHRQSQLISRRFINLIQWALLSSFYNEYRRGHFDVTMTYDFVTTLRQIKQISSNLT